MFTYSNVKTFFITYSEADNSLISIQNVPKCGLETDYHPRCNSLSDIRRTRYSPSHFDGVYIHRYQRGRRPEINCVCSIEVSVVSDNIILSRRWHVKLS
jgi:hypothetical protein